jgi:hypothetical protein
MRTVASIAKTASGIHRHVDEDAIALPDPVRLEDRGEPVDLVGELAERELARRVDLGRDPDERLLVRPRRQVPVDRVVAEIGLAAHEPAPERRIRVLEDLREGLVPVDELRLRGPEAVRIVDGILIEIAIRRHRAILLHPRLPAFDLRQPLLVDVDDEAPANLAREHVGRALERLREADLLDHRLELRGVELLREELPRLAAPLHRDEDAVHSPRG